VGRRSQERMTGKTYGERVKHARGGLRRRVGRWLAVNKPRPTRYANTRRDGLAYRKWGR